jgi:hypothetical protein
MRSLYKIWSVGNAVGIGATGAIHLGIAGVAKRATGSQPYVVSNELLCNRIAASLLLPCPPGALVEKEDEIYFFSLDFNVSGQALPPASAQRIVVERPRLAWGIVLFDILVMNGDRHAQNIAHDRANGSVRIFDHSHAFAGVSGDIGATMPARVETLNIGGHCLAAEVSLPDGFEMWCSRIKSLPDFLFQGAVEEACNLGYPGEHAGLCIDTLQKRRNSIDKLVKDNLSSFPKLQGIEP